MKHKKQTHEKSNTKTQNMVQRVYKVLQISSQVITQYTCQLASATNDIRFIFTKYTTIQWPVIEKTHKQIAVLDLIITTQCMYVHKKICYSGIVKENFRNGNMEHMC